MSNAEPEDLLMGRSIADAMSQSLLYATGRDYLARPDQLQLLFHPIDGRPRQLPPSFLRIDSIGNPLDSGQSAALSLQTALAACAGDQAHEVVFLVLSDGHTNRVYLGVRHERDVDDQFMDAFRHFFSWAHPGSTMTSLNPGMGSYAEQITNPLQKMRYGACLTGIPSTKVSRTGSLVSCLDSLLSGVPDKPFAYMVVARPLKLDEISDAVSRCRSLIGSVHHLASVSFTQGLTESHSRSEGSTNSRQTTHSRTESRGDTKLGVGTVLGGLAMAFPPAGLVASLAYAGVAVALPFLSQSRFRSAAVGESTSETISRSLTETVGISRSTQGSIEIINAHVQAAERHLEDYAERFWSNRATGLWNTEVYCLTDSGDLPTIIGSQMQAVLNGAESSLEPVRWHGIEGLMRSPSFRNGLRACESASVVFGTERDSFGHPFGELFEGLGTPLTTHELTHLLNTPQREIPGLRLVSSASFSLNGPCTDEENGVAIGNLMNCGVESNLPYLLPFSALAKHTLLAGINGSGKSTTCRTIVRSVGDEGIPFLVIEPAKDEYVEWAMELNSRMAEDDPNRIAVYMPGVNKWRGQMLTDKLVLNPLEVVWTSAEQEPEVISHIDGLKAILSGTLPMQDVLPIVLEELLYEVYARHPSRWLDGQPDIANAEFPTLTSLESLVKPLVDAKGYEPRFRMQLTEALRTRIASLCRHGWKKSLFNPKPGHVTDWGKLFDRRAVINLSKLNDPRDKAFTMALILQFLYEYRIAQAESGVLPMNAGRLRHLTVVEEAHRVMARPPSSLMGEANPQAMAAQVFSDMLSEIRAYGEGFLIVEQVPERLISDAVKNTNLKIVHRIVSKDDRDSVAGSMNLNASQAAMISKLRPGQAVICGDGDDSACWVSIRQ